MKPSRMGLRASVATAVAMSLICPATFARTQSPSAYSSVVYAPFAPRTARARPASEVAAELTRVNAFERESAFLAEVRAGNVPPFLRTMVEVKAKLPDANGKLRRIAMWVLPDYLAIGSDEDFVRVPLTPQSAQRIATDLDMALPTTKMVDLIYRQAAIQLDPKPLIREPRMTSLDALMKHERLVESQRASHAAALGALLSGHKKDVVLSRRLWNRPERVAIYGWHQQDGDPIQPLSLVHHQMYADYSHGVRLVREVVSIDGALYRLQDVLRDPTLAPLFSDEGRIVATKIPRAKRGQLAKSRYGH